MKDHHDRDAASRIINSDREAIERGECGLRYVAHRALSCPTCEDHTRASKGNREDI